MKALIFTGQVQTWFPDLRGVVDPGQVVHVSEDLAGRLLTRADWALQPEPEPESAPEPLDVEKPAKKSAK